LLPLKQEEKIAIEKKWMTPPKAHMFYRDIT
jgi:hypothetical protein